MYFDSHCHLSFPELQAQWPAVRAAMQAARVDGAICICTTLEEFEAVHALAMSDASLWASAGVHPDNEGEGVREPALADLLALAARPKVVAIGETGLDYYRLNGRSHADMAWQRERFRVHIRASRETGLPLVIHTRSASDDTLAILREEGARHGVFHCFTETEAVAREALALGFHISFSGILTFRNAVELREVARWVPLERCLIETDSPYLAPVPMRGKLNTPALVPHVAAQLAELKGLPVETVAAATTANARRLFALPATPTE
ncbi:TatD family hydrolase [Piscinibacter sakaiensis]|uniref:Putative deoxyribonuclease YcfH n=1 Tax=Piscinibacter sakaiensis TaxID=1547922 RepID=A0A0K8NXQ3_PISS1|nr:TatD family hydrolase [Piscinibacter sakaiensis]GAP34710.1 putative deoxyribonuclease YcfH [Piscinibacter sakaiensis]